MVLKTDKPKRLYYSIKEVAEMVGVAEYATLLGKGVSQSSS